MVSLDSRETHQGPAKRLFPQDKLHVEIGGEGEFPAVGGCGSGFCSDPSAERCLHVDPI